MTKEIMSAAELSAEVGFLKSRVDDLTKQRASLPRNDKTTAHALLVEINATQTELRQMKHRLSVANVEENLRHQASVRHGMWATAVKELFGADGLLACERHMHEQARARKSAQRNANISETAT